MEAATGQSGGVLIVLAIISAISAITVAWLATRNTKDRVEKKVVAAADTAAAATAEQAKDAFEVLSQQLLQQLHDSYNRELDRLHSETQRKDTRIQQLEERLDG